MKRKSEKVRRKKMQVREKVEKSRNIVFFQWICGFGGSTDRQTDRKTDKQTDRERERERKMKKER